MTAVIYGGGLGKGFSLQECGHHDMVVMTPLAGLVSFVFLVLFVDTVLGM